MMDSDIPELQAIQRSGKMDMLRYAIVTAEADGKSIRVEQPDWARCPACGKTGSHTHGKPRADET